jgi:thiol:disulfide interchange protein DsbD
MLRNNFFQKINKNKLLVILGVYYCVLLGCKVNNDHRYSEIFGAYHSPISFFDYEEALVAAQKSNKPLLIIFGGWGVVNSTRFEKEVISRKEVISFIEENFILLNLYVDDRTILPESEWIKAKGTNRIVKTIGVKNGHLELDKFSRSDQPYWGVLGDTGNVIAEGNTDYKGFLSFLKETKQRYIGKQNKE